MTDADDRAEKRRLLKKRGTPRFKRHGTHMKRVRDSWRKPHGHHSKTRLKKKHAGAMPTVGYRSPRKVRGLHPSGREDVLVHNKSELEAVEDAENTAIRFSSTLGKRKKEMLTRRAFEKDLYVINPANIEQEEREK